MKKIIFLSICFLSACNVTNHSHTDNQKTSDLINRLINESSAKIDVVQTQLMQILNPVTYVVPQPDSTRTFSQWPDLKIIGTPPQAINLVQAAGINEPLPTALATIAPPGWRIDVSPRLRKRKISWTGNDQWICILQKIAMKEKIRIEINFYKRSITVT